MLHTTRPAARARLILADRHAMVVEGLSLRLRGECDVVATAADGHVLQALIAAFDPDIVVTEIDLPQITGLDVLREARRQRRRARFVMLSGNESPYLAHLALEAGADAFVLKQERVADMLVAIGLAARGRSYVSPRLRDAMRGTRVRTLTEKRRRIVRMLADGLKPKQIAAALGLSVRTVEQQKYLVMQMLHVHSTLELVLHAESLGLLY